MRKIEEKMVQAILNEKDFSMDNTRVVFNGLGNYMCSIYLHDNEIAKKDRTGSWYLNNNVCLSWNTPTTRSRLNALVSALKSSHYDGVNTKKGVLYIHYDSKIIPMDNKQLFTYIGK